jgi:hypothetical protein
METLEEYYDHVVLELRGGCSAASMSNCADKYVGLVLERQNECCHMYNIQYGGIHMIAIVVCNYLLPTCNSSTVSRRM